MAEVLFVIDGGAHRSPARLDQLTGELRADLEEIRGVGVRPVTGPAAADAKSGVVEQIGQLAVSGGALGTAAWLIRDIVAAFIARSGTRSITVKKGDAEVTITAASATQIDRLIDLLGDD
ncbi:effector-associated constant component EACC1 [Nocardia sp. NBC_00416]|uniref:effector-associated constant component EACC1 n=1 Tax=Nocardia sp. NBC_00416 TaxID=2975991 RepID=UPI002E21AAD7